MRTTSVAVIPKLLDHSYIQSSFPTIMRRLDNSIWKTPYNWRFYGFGSTQVSSLHQYIWLIIVCTSFSQTTPFLNLTWCWSKNFRHNLFTFLPFEILWILKFIQYFYEPVKFWWSSILLNCEGLYRFVKAIFLFSIKY